MKKKDLIFGFAFGFIIAIFLIHSGLVNAEQPPKFWISNLEGKRFHSLKQDRPYIISFFFVGCVPCIKEIPELHRIIKEKHPDVGLLFIDPLAEDSKTNIRAFAKSLHVPTDYFYHDALGRIGKKFMKGRMAFPTIIGIKDRQFIFKFSSLDDKNIEKLNTVLK